MIIKSLTIYCSSSDLLDQKYYDLSYKISEFLCKKHISIIYGGGKVGMMGKISESAMNAGGKVVGIIPKFLDSKEHTLLTLVDEYYDENDFKDFCNSILNNNFSIMVAIKEFHFPDEYLKNYSVIIDRQKQIITQSIEKSKNIVSINLKYILR